MSERDSEEMIDIDRAFNNISIDTIKNVSRDAANVASIRSSFEKSGLKVNLSDEEIVDRCNQISTNNSKVEELKKIPVVEQRSEEWYKIRDQMITASDFGQALGVGKFGSTKDFYIKKCGYQEPSPFYGASLAHGIRYEPVATRAYEIKMNTKVHEFGLLQHPELKFLGASPDGITDHGIMLEIKCPFKRKIDGTIVDQYLYQMQGQLDVCQLDVCHFLECKFEEYIDEIAFEEDWNEDFTLSSEGHMKGVIIEFEGPTSPVYSDPGLTKNEYKNWLAKKIVEFHDKEFVVIYYMLSQYSVQVVERDDEFLKEKNELLGNTWSNILKYKSNKQSYDEEIGTKPPPKKRPVKCLFRDIE